MSHPADSLPVVSVVMIFLNGQKFMDEAVRSVLAQTFPSWELLFVDDGSTDQSTTIAQRYAAEYPSKIRYLQHPEHQNRGMSASRNLGIRSSRGRFLALLDCDDLWHPEKLEQQVAILNREPEAAMVYSATMQWFTWPGAPAGSRRDEPRPLGVTPDQLMRPLEMIPIFLCDIGNTPATCSVLMRREAVEAVGAFEESFRGLHEDQAFFYKFFLRYPVYVQAGCWDWYRQHPESCCSVAESVGISVRLPINSNHGRFLDWVRGYLDEAGIEDSRIRDALAYAQLPFTHPHRYRVTQAALAARDHSHRILLGVARRLLPTAAYAWLRRRLTPARAPMASATAPTISVLMPVHNGARYVGAAIRSVLAQSFGDFEFLIVDDGSTDDTPAILERWRKRDPRILVLRQKQTGIVGALNAGLKLARGRYIARMDADDVCMPARFERQIRFLDEHPEVVGLGTWTWHVDPAGRRLKLACDHVRSEDIEAGLLRGEGAALPHPTLMARTDALRLIGGYRREYDLAEDMDLYFRLLEHGHLANLPEPLLYYRLHYNSTNHTRAEQQWTLVGRMLAEQNTRRGLPIPPPAPRPARNTHAQCHRRWARHAVAGRSWLPAGIHGLHALARAPFDSRNHYVVRFIASQWRRAVFERLSRLVPGFNSRACKSG